MSGVKSIVVAGLFFSFLLADICLAADPSPIAVLRELEDRVTYPHPLIICAKRLLKETPVGYERTKLRTLAERYQKHLQRGSVRIGNSWVEVDLQIERLGKFRAQVHKINKELMELDAKLRSSLEGNDKNAARLNKAAQQYRNERITKFLRLAKDYPDMEIRNFLIAQTRYLSGDTRGAEKLFARCIQDNPFVAAYYQGHARAAEDNGDLLAAAESWCCAVTLTDRRSALWQLKFVLDKLQDAGDTSERYLAAKRFYDELGLNFRERRWRGGDKLSWHMPKYDMDISPYGLVMPHCTGYDINDYIAIAVDSSGTFLIDSRALRNQYAMFLQMPDAEGVSSLLKLERARVKSNPANAIPANLQQEPFTMVNLCVQGVYEFEPVSVAEEADNPVDGQLQAYSVGLYPQLDHSQLRHQQFSPDLLSNKHVEDDQLPLKPGELGAFVFNDDGQLAGAIYSMLCLNIDSMADQQLLTAAEMGEIITEMKDKYKPISSRKAKLPEYGRPQIVPGSCFVVHVLVGRDINDSYADGF